MKKVDVLENVSWEVFIIVIMQDVVKCAYDIVCYVLFQMQLGAILLFL